MAKDDSSKPVHLTAFMGYKAGMTHVDRYFEKREGKKSIKKDIVEPVTVIECPPIKVIGMVGYITTPRGLRTLATVYAQSLPTGVIRRFYKNYHVAKRNAFKNYRKNRYLNRIEKYCSTVRVLCCTQIEKLKFRQRKSHIMEIQLNGGTVAEKVAWAKSHFEQEVSVGE